ncbi:MAG: hypothetical protein HY983_00290 [Candidatus Magasanikbacteria bacterium]|nr:hypothetical protein [Candidatus Magasanikbacteria bacterium]
MSDQATVALFGIPFLVFGLAMYVYMSYALQVMARKTGTPNRWLAWIPVINVFLLVKVAGKSYWWVLLFLIPFVNIVIAVIVYMTIAERLNKPAWVGVLIIVPFINIFVPGYLAFSKGPGLGSASMNPPATPSVG